MATQRQIAANRRNAASSSGPRTAKGKGVASKNALKHGLTAREILVPGENSDEFEALVQRLISELDPEGELELQLVERIATCLWRQRRIYRIESEMLTAEYIEYEIRRLQDLATMQTKSTLDLLLAPTEFVSKKAHATYDAAQEDMRQAKLKLVEANVGVGKAFERGVRGADTLSKLSRYEAGIERALYKAVHELQRLQARRTGDNAGVPQAIDIDVSATP